MSIIELVLKDLRENVESYQEYDDGWWGDVYLDNLSLSISRKELTGYLSQLRQRGLYRPLDGYAFGCVKLADAPEWVNDSEVRQVTIR